MQHAQGYSDIHPSYPLCQPTIMLNWNLRAQIKTQARYFSPPITSGTL